MRRRLRVSVVVALALAVVGCSEDDRDDVSTLEFETRLLGPEPPPPSAIVTDRLEYLPLEETRRRHDAVEAGARVALDPALTTGLRPAPLARVAHVADVQLREERAQLFLFGELAETLPGASLVSPLEASARPPLVAANSAFVWHGLVLTLNELHRTAPLDAVVHAGDAVDVNLRSELWRFLDVGRRLDAPLLLAAGNHDILAWGVWPRGEPALGTSLDSDVELTTPEVAATFAANDDALLGSQAEHLRAVRQVVDEHGPHAPTVAAFGAELFGYDVATVTSALYYVVELEAPAAGRPGVQLVVLETTRDDGGSGPEIDDPQLAWLAGVLAAPRTRQSVVVVVGHHPLVRTDEQDVPALLPVEDLDPLRDLLLANPNVAVYLTAHTHEPEVLTIPAPGGGVGILQVNPGPLLLFPQTAALVELAVDGPDLVIEARRFGPMIAPGSVLAGHLAESSAAAAADAEAEPPFWDRVEVRKPLPSFTPAP